MNSEDLTDVEREQLLLEKKMHLSAIIDQLRLMSKFMKNYVGRHTSSQSMPETNINNLYEDTLHDMFVEHKTLFEIQV